MLRKVVCFFILLFSFNVANALSDARVHKIYLTEKDGAEVLTIVIDSPVQYDIFTANKSKELIIDLKNSSLKAGFNSKNASKKIKHHKYPNKLRFSVNFKNCVIPKEVVLEKQQNGMYHIIVKLDACDVSGIKGHVIDKKMLNTASSTKDLIVAIDAGHGGKDPGAVGLNGAKESDVTLTVAKKLADRINAKKGMRAVLVRSSDEYVALKDRTKIAKLYNADLFISIHADAFHNREVRGASTFVFSKKAEQHGRRNSVIEEIVKHENTFDLGNSNTIPANALYDISESRSSKYSVELAKSILNEVAKVSDLHKGHVEQGMFVVLRHTDMPAVLVELGFLSNEATELKLLDSTYQTELVNSMLLGIDSFYKQRPSIKFDNTKLAGFSRRAHIVSQGETLSKIAERYGIGLKLLKEVNNLSNSLIKVGSRLTIPIMF